jgi:pseudouridine-5'-phosphate glycosidase
MVGFLPRTVAVYIGICHVGVSRNGLAELYEQGELEKGERRRALRE